MSHSLNFRRFLFAVAWSLTTLILWLGGTILLSLVWGMRLDFPLTVIALFSLLPFAVGAWLTARIRDELLHWLTGVEQHLRAKMFRTFMIAVLVVLVTFWLTITIGLSIMIDTLGSNNAYVWFFAEFFVVFAVVQAVQEWFIFPKIGVNSAIWLLTNLVGVYLGAQLWAYTGYQIITTAMPDLGSFLWPYFYTPNFILQWPLVLIGLLLHSLCVGVGLATIRVKQEEQVWQAVS